MPEWIIKYWVEFAFGALVAFGSWAWRNYLKMVETDRKAQREKFFADLSSRIDERFEASQNKSKEDDAILQGEINEMTKAMNNLKKGLLSIQGRSFKASCIDCLKPEHVISEDEYSNLLADHEAYHCLGGNHDGDKLWEAVEIKFHNHL